MIRARFSVAAGVAGELVLSTGRKNPRVAGHIKFERFLCFFADLRHTSKAAAIVVGIDPSPGKRLIDEVAGAGGDALGPCRTLGKP